MSKKQPTGWIGFDLDGCLAHYDHWRGADHIGEPVPLIVDAVRQYLAKGIEVRIVTARVGQGPEGSNDKTKNRIEEARAVIKAWCEKHIGVSLPVTCSKDFAMVMLYDDRCVAIEPNTGVILVDYYRAAADAMNAHLEEIRTTLGVVHQKDIMGEIRRLVK